MILILSESGIFPFPFCDKVKQLFVSMQGIHLLVFYGKDFR